MIRKLVSRALIVICAPTSVALGEGIAEKIILAICVIGIGLAGGLMATEEQS
jgi:hypothetical protein